MNLKEEKGITLIALIIIVILTIILAVIGLEFGQDAIDKANLEDIKTDMISIKTKAKISAEQKNFEDIDELPGIEITADEISKFNIEEEIAEENFKKLDANTLLSLGLSTIEANKYIVYYNLDDTNNCEVYYINGIGGKYSLEELKDI